MKNKKIENQSLTHGSVDRFEYTFYNEQINRLQQQIDYGSAKKPTGVIRCIQINLRHSKSASLTLSQLLFDLNIDIVFIQEPNAIIENGICIPNVPNG